VVGLCLSCPGICVEGLTDSTPYISQVHVPRFVTGTLKHKAADSLSLGLMIRKSSHAGVKRRSIHLKESWVAQSV